MVDEHDGDVRAGGETLEGVLNLRGGRLCGQTSTGRGDGAGVGDSAAAGGARGSSLESTTMKFEVRLASTFPTPANSMPVTVSSSPITAISAPFCSIPFFCAAEGTAAV